MDYDVIIIGASVGGASLALELGKSKISVALFDKARFPRRKACGEGLSHMGIASLDGLGLKEKLLSLPHSPFLGFKVWRGNNCASLSLSLDDRGKGIGIERRHLDNLLVTEACATGYVEPVFGTQVREIKEINGLYAVSDDKMASTAPYLVLADGANSFLAKRLKIPERTSSPNRYGSCYTLKGKASAEPRYVTIIVKDGFEIYCTPLSDYLLNVSFLGSRGSLSEIFGRASSTKIEDFLEEAAQKTGFFGTSEQPPAASGPLGRRIQKGYFGNILLVGDSVETFDPIGGMGMSHALMSSHAAASVLYQVIRNGACSSSQFKRYDVERKKQAKLLRGFTRVAYYGIKSLSRTPLLRAAERSSLGPLLGSSLTQFSTERPYSEKFARAVLTTVGL